MAVAGLLALLPACGSDADGTRAGGVDPVPVTLRLGVPENDLAPYAPWVREFAAKTAEISDGSVRIEVLWDATQPWHPEAEVEIAEWVGEGELDLALVPSRAWTDLGVTSLAAVMTPFLVDSNDLVAHIVEDEVAEDLMADLPDVGVVGLALLPEGLRIPMSFGHALVAADDFEGLRIRVPASDYSDQVLRSVGASPITTQLSPEHMREGEFHTAETSLEWFGNTQRPADTIVTYTANIVFFPKVQVLAANAGLLEGLGSDQRRALIDAAVAARTLAVREWPTLAESAEKVCAGGGAVALAPPWEVAELAARTQGLVRELESEPTVRASIDRIRALKQTFAAVEPPEPCAPETDHRYDSFLEEHTVESVPADFPEGVYRLDLPREALEDLGLPPEAAKNARGLNTLEIRDGAFSWESPHGNPPTCEGTATDTHGVLVLHIERSCFFIDETVLVAQWRLDGDQLTFLPIVSGGGIDEWDLEWGLHFITAPWTKVA
jgi:TRAP-type C4-dicarboxylate transport system substrate-binding protein